MQRTQIYLSEEEAQALDRLAKERGQTRSHLIREAIHETYLAGSLSDARFERLLDVAFGGWGGRTAEEQAERERWMADLRGPGLGRRIAEGRGEPAPIPPENGSR